MKIVDAQIHLWTQGLPTNPAHRQVPHYTAEECLREMDAGGVDAALIHPPGWDANSGAVAEDAARKYPGRFAILGNFPLDKPESRALVAGWKARPGMLGLRFALLAPHQRSWPTDGTMDWLWPACEKAGIPVALMATDFLPTVAKVAERHPGLKLLVDHFGRARGAKDAAAFSNAGEVAALAKHPNVALKATGAAGEFERALPVRQHPPLYPPALRRLWADALLLGHRHHPHAVLMERVRDHVHRGNAVAHRPRPGARHGPRALRLARLEAAGVIADTHRSAGAMSVWPKSSPLNSSGSPVIRASA